MPLAFFLINTRIGKENEVCEELKGGLYRNNIKNIDFVYGVYDMVARVEVEYSKQFRDVRNYVKDIPNVKSILPLIVE